MNELNETCPFCNKKILTATWLESINFRAVYNLAPVFPGHTLIIPKLHIESMFELNIKELNEMFTFAHKCANILRGEYDSNSFNWLIQDGVDSGQTISHLHLHIIPRRKKDLPNPTDWESHFQKVKSDFIENGYRPTLPQKEIKKIVNKLKKASVNK